MAGSALRSVLGRAAAIPLRGSFWGALVTLLVQSRNHDDDDRSRQRGPLDVAAGVGLRLRCERRDEYRLAGRTYWRPRHRRCAADDLHPLTDQTSEPRSGIRSGWRARRVWALVFGLAAIRRYRAAPRLRAQPRLRFASHRRIVVRCVRRPAGRAPLRVEAPTCRFHQSRRVVESVPCAHESSWFVRIGRFGHIRQEDLCLAQRISGLRYRYGILVQTNCFVAARSRQGAASVETHTAASARAIVRRHGHDRTSECRWIAIHRDQQDAMRSAMRDAPALRGFSACRPERSPRRAPWSWANSGAPTAAPRWLRSRTER
jgi:hypothetical protein